MTTPFEKLACEDWLAAFVEYASFGESLPKLLYWTGVSTIAAALQRRVWLDCGYFTWSPNFYILIVGEQGVVRKSSTIDIGMDLLEGIEGVEMGPDAATWQALVKDMQRVTRYVTVGDECFEMSALTLALSEFGTFFDPDDRNQIDALTSLWDGRKRFRKITIGRGEELVEGPWINLIAATTPQWIAQHMPAGTIGGGFMSRLIVLRGEMPDKDVAWPHRVMPPHFRQWRAALHARLCELAKFTGPLTMTEEAYDWVQRWYEGVRASLRASGAASLDAGFLSRKQVHLTKLAMAVSASRGNLPIIGVGHVEEAHKRLLALEDDATSVFAMVGRTKLTAAAQAIVEAVGKAGSNGIERRVLYRKQFFWTMDSGEYDAAIKSAVQAELILEVADVARPILMMRKA